jgi:hypothetical protein
LGDLYEFCKNGIVTYGSNMLIADLKFQKKKNVGISANLAIAVADALV